MKKRVIANVLLATCIFSTLTPMDVWAVDNNKSVQATGVLQEPQADPNVSKKGWVSEGGKWYFYKQDSTLTKGWSKQGAVWYYLDDTTGERKSGFIKVQGKDYYLNADGIMQSDWFKIEGKWYLTDGSGALKTGWHYHGNQWYYIKAQGEMAVGFQNVGGRDYYLNSVGIMESNWFRIDGRWYLADGSGALKNGWYPSGNQWYYIKAQGEMAVGFQNVGGRDYFLNSVGIMESNWFKIDGRWYFADGSGALKTGWNYYGNQWYYIKAKGEMTIGWVELSGKWYYLDGSGIMKTGWVKINEQSYFFNASGEWTTGATTETTAGGTWTKTDGEYYYKDKDGKMQTGVTVVENGKEYYLHPSGKMATFEYVGEKYYGKDGATKNFANGEKILIVLDPGHNFGGDEGAYAIHSGITYSERDLNMKLAMKVKAQLEMSGYEVVLTRQESDRDQIPMRESLRKRVDLANSLRTDMFISLHHDSYTNASANGITSFYGTYRPNIEAGGFVMDGDVEIDQTPGRAANVSINFSNALNKTLSAEMNYTNRGAKDWWLYVTRYTTMPSILLESGFISNPNEARRAADPANQQEIANKITKELNNLFPKR